ncbi:MAG: prepilin peptidase [Chloroflexi bacterium]|nr:prepilin peptidase [Chloroflexota bacterium]
MDASLSLGLKLALLGAGVGLLWDLIAMAIVQGDVRAVARCEACGARVGWTARWRACPVCGHRPRRPWVLAGLLAGVSALLPWIGRWPVLALWPVTACFMLHAVIDWDARLVYIPLVAVSLLLCGVIGVGMHGWARTAWGLVGGAVLMLLLYILGMGFVRWRGLGDEPGLGFGDVWLAALVGVVLGWPGVIAGLFLGAMLAGVYALGLVLYHAVRHRRWIGEHPIPYGPFLLLGAWLLLLGKGG